MKPSILLKVAHWGMATTLIASLGIIYVIYGMDYGLKIPMLVFLHIFLVLTAAIFKISYVVRLNALQQLGRPNH